MRGAAPLAALLVVLTVAARAGAAEEDPEVTACKQQCARQRQFGAAERRYCAAACGEEGPEKERDRCLHECRAGPPKPGCERRCVEEYERATGGGGGSRTRRREEVAVAGRRFRGLWQHAAA
jgi:hypothetical protein